MTDTFEDLRAEFKDGVVKIRPGSYTKDKKKAMVLHYIDARDVMDRLDAVVGELKWSDRYAAMDGGAVECTLTLHLEGAENDWVTHADVGYPNAEGDSEPLKGAYSDALKRAAVKFGIGRYLYDYETEWREVDEWGHFKAMFPEAKPGKDFYEGESIVDEAKKIADQGDARVVRDADPPHPAEDDIPPSGPELHNAIYGHIDDPDGGTKASIPEGGRHMEAKFAGSCKRCDNQILVGETIYYHRASTAAYCWKCAPREVTA